MAILTPANAQQFAPGLPDAMVANEMLLTAQIAYIQAQIEGPKGANRPIELTQFIEVLPLTKTTQSAFPRYFPIADDPAMVVEARQANHMDHLHQSSGVSDWDTIPDSQWELSENGRLDLDPSAYGKQAFSQDRYQRYNEVRLTYTAGYDFTDDSDSDVLLVRAIAGQMLQYIASDLYKGIKRFKAEKEIEVEFQSMNNAAPGNIPESFFLPLKKYAPIGI